MKFVESLIKEEVLPPKGLKLVGKKLREGLSGGSYGPNYGFERRYLYCEFWVDRRSAMFGGYEK